MGLGVQVECLREGTYFLAFFGVPSFCRYLSGSFRRLVSQPAQQRRYSRPRTVTVFEDSVTLPPRTGQVVLVAGRGLAAGAAKRVRANRGASMETPLVGC